MSTSTEEKGFRQTMKSAFNKVTHRYHMAVAQNMMDDYVNPEKGIIGKSLGIVVDAANIATFGAMRGSLNFVATHAPIIKNQKDVGLYNTDQLKATINPQIDGGEKILSSNDYLRTMMSTDQGSTRFELRQEEVGKILDKNSVELGDVDKYNKAVQAEKQSKKEAKAAAKAAKKRDVPSVESGGIDAADTEYC